MKFLKVFFIVLLILLLIGGAGVVALYLTTDLLKSNQEMFYKYLSQENMSSLIDSDFIQDYIEQIKEEPHSMSIKLVANQKENGQTVLKNSKINIENNVDNKEGFLESTIVFGDSKSKDLLEFDILRNQDVYGVKVKDIITQYLSVENKDLKKLVNKFGFNSNDFNIPDKIETDKIFDKFYDIQGFIGNTDKIYTYIKEEIPKSRYSKIEKTNIEIDKEKQEVSGYRLKLNNQETIGLIDKLNIELVEKIEDIINLKQESLNMEILLYIKDKKMVKLNIILSSGDDYLISLSKTFNNGNDEYNLEILADTEQKIINIVKESDNNVIKFIIQASIISGATSFDVDAEITTDFGADFTIKKFDDKNSVIINEMESATLIEVIKIIGKKIYNDTGFKDTILNMFYESNPLIKRAQTSMENADVQIHNSMFLQYEGEQKGSAVKSLLNIIETNNATSGNIVIKILFNNSDEQVEIDSSKKYKVSFQYDDEGYINLVNIEYK